MKVLFIAGGRRVSLAERFMDHRCAVSSYETETNCPISTVARVIKGKTWDDPDIEKHIKDVIYTEEIDLVIPLADKATRILSNIDHPGIVTSTKNANIICLNKKKFEECLFEYDFYPKPEENSNVILKPVEGANSKGLKTVSYFEYSNNKYSFAEKYVAQRLVEGFEISVDAYFNKQSEMVDAVPRKRIEVQGGEVSRSSTLWRNAYGVSELTAKIGKQIGLRGPVCAQYIVSDKPYIMEINSRFGGGVILSLQAGFDQIQLLIDEWLNNKAVIPQNYNWKENVGMVRYFNEYFYRG